MGCHVSAPESAQTTLRYQALAVLPHLHGIVQKCTILKMKSAELLRKLKKIAKQRGVDLTTETGKGSHQKVRLGDRRTIVPIHRAAN